MTLKVSDVAKYFLAKSDEEAGDAITNLKLQKLVYYAQGFSLVLLNRPLFNEPIEAWTHGPVVSSLYDEYKKYGSNTIPIPTDVDFSTYSKEEKELMDEVYDVYGQYSAWRLREMTHEEPPWKDAYADSPGSVIPHDSMKRFFNTLVEYNGAEDH